MSSPVQNSRIALVDIHGTRTLPHYDPALNSNNQVISDSDSRDWVRQELRKLDFKDARLRTFLADYDQCKSARLEGLFQSMVAASYFEPPSGYTYWAPTNIIGENTERSYPSPSPTFWQVFHHFRQGYAATEHSYASVSPTFSQALDQFRVFLQKGKPGCARFCRTSLYSCVRQCEN